MNYEVTGRNSAEMLDGEYSEEIPKQSPLCNRDFNNNFTNGAENDLGRKRRCSLGSSRSNESLLVTSIKKSDEEYAATKTTEAILAEIFGQNTSIPEQRKTRYFNGETFGQHHTKGNYNGIEVTNSHRKNASIIVEPENMREGTSITSPCNDDTSSKHFEESNNESLSKGEYDYVRNDFTTNNQLQSKRSLKEITYGKEMLSSSDQSQIALENNAENRLPLNGVKRLYQNTSSKQRAFSSIENASYLDKYPTLKDIPSTRPESNGRSLKSKISKQMTSGPAALHRTPLVQSNVVNYYEKLRNEGKVQSFHETSFTARTTSRKGFRSKSSETPIMNDLSTSSYSLSKSWGPTRSRKEFQSLNGNSEKSKDQTNDLSQKKKIEQMFQMEEAISLKRAQEFEKSKLLGKVFVAWQRRTQDLNLKADELCRLHLLRKGLQGFMYAMENKKMAVDRFTRKRSKVLVVKCWRMWRQKTRERQRKKMEETFAQWRFYQLHVERTKLLENIANRHFLSKNYSKWKAQFNSKQKNSLANVHFKINLIYKYWNCWTVYVKERRVKNRLNITARYHYREKIQCHLFQYWKTITRKSLLSRRLTRRRILLKAFFHWKHWTQYAKIVHLRLQNMCKEYHKKTLTRRMFKKWRQAKRMKMAVEFCRKKQQSRAMKLWNLRYMRKRIHKHLCKALAKKAKKRRFLEKWICYVNLQKKSRREFIKILQIVHIRTFFKYWRNETTERIQMRKSLKTFQQDRVKRIVHRHWESWKFQLKIMEMRDRSKRNWSLRCVRKCCQVWKLKMKKTQLEIKLHQSCSTFEILVVRRYFHTWTLQFQKVREEFTRAENVMRILQRNRLGRVLQAWRVVNQEECIIEPLVKRRVRKDMARVFDAWRRYISRGTGLRRLHNTKNDRLKRVAWETWSVRLWCRVKEKEVKETLRFSKVARHFFVWLEYVRELRESERIAEQRKESMMRKYIQTWKKNAAQKAELRESEHVRKCHRQILLRCFFTSWKQKATEHAQCTTSMIRRADETRQRILVKRSLLRWQRQYLVEIKTREYLKFKQNEVLKTIVWAWKDFVKTELERQVCDFATNLAMDSSQGSAFLSTSGYQTSLKNSSSSFQFAAADEEIFSPIPTPRSRPVTPTLNHDDPKSFTILPSYRPVTIDRHTTLISERPTSRCASPLTRRSLEQISQTSPQRSSEDDTVLSSAGVHSSGIHSAGDESEQDDRMSIHVTESLYSYQTTSDGVARDRELLVAETIIHWRSLSLSVAFRSWYKYTRHMNLVRMTYCEWMARDKERLVTKYLGKWRRWLFVSVLARQHWVNQMKKKFLFQWIKYRKQQFQRRRQKDEADDFSKRNLLKKSYNTWKHKRTAKCQLQNIVLRWQRSAKVTDMDKQVIEQYKIRDRMNCLRRTFHYWKKAARCSQQATYMSQTLSLRRCVLAWRDIASFRTKHRKKMETFRAKHVLAKAFNEWLLRYEDVRTAKIILGVSEERKIDKIFKSWHSWAKATSYRRKVSLAYYRSQEERKLKEKFLFWFAAAKECIKIREYYHKSLQRRILRSWHTVLVQKANTNTSIQEFQSIVLKNLLRSTFVFWRKKTKNNETMVEYLKLKKKRHLASTFNRWKQQKRKQDAKKHFSKSLMRKTFMCWREQILKRNKARQHFKFWQTKAEGNKELNQIADTLVYNSENNLLRMKFIFWRKLANHSQVGKYHHETKMLRRHFLGWYEHFSKEKRLLNQLKEFQRSHQRNDSGLLSKYMKIWLNKSTFSTKAENLYNETLYSRYWKMWRHSFVRRRVSLAMVDHDNQKILSQVFISWFEVTASHKNISKEIKSACLRKWFRKWMARYNNS